jgi:cytochrome c556
MACSSRATTRTSASRTELVIAAGIAAAVIGPWLATYAQTATQADKVAPFMRIKLTHSQDVLEGLAVEDFDLIDRGAQQLSLTSEDASWQVLQTEDYARMSADFRRSCDRLRAAARGKNLDGAALAWMEVTMKCVQCHKYIRDRDDDAAAR